MRTALALLVVSTALSPQPPASASLDVITARMQDYARGITENRFEVGCKISRFDPAGKLAKVRTTTHSLEFTKGVYKSSSGAVPADWNATWVVHGDRKTLGLEIHTDDGALFPVFVFSPAKRKLMVFDTAAGPNGSALTVSYGTAEACHTFKPMTKGFGLADISCGSGQIVLDENAAIPLRSSFEGAGFPLLSGKESISGFHVDSEFEAVVLPGAKRPFVFPKNVIATFGFSEGKVIVDCDYQLHPNKRK